MKKSLFFFIISLFIYSCNDINKSSQEHSIKVVRNFLELELNDSTANISRGLQAYTIDGLEILFNINWGLNSLQMYDLEKSKFINEIFFETEGDKSVGRVFGFHVHNLDSIFLFTQKNSNIVIIDTAYSIKSRIEYNVPDVYSNAFVHNAYFISPPILENNKLTVKSHIQGSYRSMTDAELEQKALSYSINMDNGHVSMMNYLYPNSYLDKGLKFYEYSMAKKNENLVFSFFGDHRLFYASKADENQLKSKKVKSQYLSDNLPIFPKNGAREATYEYLFASDHYESLLYDEYRNIYYRFAFPKQSFQNMEELSQLRDAPNSFSIMILDDNLEVMDEVLFDNSRNVPNNVFIGKDGLYISTSHPKNPDNKEGKMVFDLLRIENN